jgi:hypothetical protein
MSAFDDRQKNNSFDLTSVIAQHFGPCRNDPDSKTPKEMK